jgi:hypothetical protein
MLTTAASSEAGLLLVVTADPEVEELRQQEGAERRFGGPRGLFRPGDRVEVSTRRWHRRLLRTR